MSGLTPFERCLLASAQLVLAVSVVLTVAVFGFYFVRGYL